MEAKELEVLSAVLQVLKPILFGLVRETGVDRARMSSTLQSFAEHDALMPEARSMLADLALGLAVTAAAGASKN